MSAVTPESAVGLILSSGKSELVRSPMGKVVAAQAGEIVFAGDVLKTHGDKVSFLFCPARSSQVVSPFAEVLFGEAEMLLRAGTVLSATSTGSCWLPTLVRVAVNSRQRFAVKTVRGLEPVPESDLSDEVRRELASINLVGMEPIEPVVRIQRANVFERHNLFANALIEYMEARKQWREVPWLDLKIRELSMAIESGSRN